MMLFFWWRMLFWFFKGWLSKSSHFFSDQHRVTQNLSNCATYFLALIIKRIYYALFAVIRLKAVFFFCVKILCWIHSNANRSQQWQVVKRSKLIVLLVSSLAIITYVGVRMSFCLHCEVYKEPEPVTLASLCFHAHKWNTNVRSPSNNRVNTAPLRPEPNC